MCMQFEFKVYLFNCACPENAMECVLGEGGEILTKTWIPFSIRSRHSVPIKLHLWSFPKCIMTIICITKTVDFRLYISVGDRCTPNRPNKLGANGHLSSHVTDTKGCGSSASPWIISANPGQTIQLDLIDFAAKSQTSNLVSCRSVYGFILERALGINHTICGGRHREGALYTSKTNSIEVQILQKEKRSGAQFIINYSGN